MRVALLALVAAALLAPAARADGPVDPVALQADITYGLDRAAAYWGTAPACQDGVQVIYNDAVVGASGMASETPGCRMYYGDIFVGRFDRTERCRDLVHEWDHLLGHGHTPAGDADNVMPYNTDASGGLYINTASTCFLASVPVSAAAMVAAAWAAQNPPAAPTPAAPAVAAVMWPAVAAVRAYFAAVQKHERYHEQRAECQARARTAKHRNGRQRAHARCRTRWPNRPVPARPR